MVKNDSVYVCVYLRAYVCVCVLMEIQPRELCMLSTVPMNYVSQAYTYSSDAHMISNLELDISPKGYDSFNVGLCWKQD